jgi:hypothetical protein
LRRCDGSLSTHILNLGHNEGFMDAVKSRGRNTRMGCILIYAGRVSIARVALATLRGALFTLKVWSEIKPVDHETLVSGRGQFE